MKGPRMVRAPRYLRELGKVRDVAERCGIDAALAEAHGKLPVYINPRLRTTAGRVLSFRACGTVLRIELAAELLRDEEHLRATFIHELAHCIAGPNAGHNAQWKAAVRKLGGKPSRHHNYKWAKKN
jgi:hypothetical protein